MTDEQLPGQSNFIQSEKTLAAEAYKLLRRYDRLDDKHNKVIAEIHEVILEFGRKLAVGQEMYGSGKEFGRWIERRNLNTTKMGENQQERTAAILIARLHDTGSEPSEEDLAVGVVPCRLDLTHCKRTRPTDIMKWARKDQPQVFPHLSRHATPTAKAKVSPARSPHGVPADAIPEFSDVRKLLARVLREVDNLPEELRGAIEAALAE